MVFPSISGEVSARRVKLLLNEVIRSMAFGRDRISLALFEAQILMPGNILLK